MSRRRKKKVMAARNKPGRAFPRSALMVEKKRRFEAKIARGQNE